MAGVCDGICHAAVLAFCGIKFTVLFKYGMRAGRSFAGKTFSLTERMNLLGVAPDLAAADHRCGEWRGVGNA